MSEDYCVTIRCTRAVPKMPLSPASVEPFIDFICLASIVPCCWCGGRSVVDEPFPGACQPRFRLICSRCGRVWCVSVGGGDETLELKLTIPDYAPRRWRPGIKRETNDIAWNVYVHDMLCMGEEIVDRSTWESLQ